MFCSNCGKEIPNESRFCMNCGGNLQVLPQETIAASTPRTSKVSFTDYHLFDWAGECPACETIHTSANCTCPNDGSPVVVGFRKVKKPKAWFYPLWAAQMCCLKDCGLGVTAFPCSNCGQLITGRYITFRFPDKFIRSYKRLFILFRVLCFLSFVTICAAIFILVKGFAAQAPVPGQFVPSGEVPHPEDFYWILLHYTTIPGIIAFLVFGYTYFRIITYRGKEIFDFTDVAAAAKEMAKAEAIDDAIKSAKAVQAATKPWKLGSDS